MMTRCALAILFALPAFHAVAATQVAATANPVTAPESTPAAGAGIMAEPVPPFVDQAFSAWDRNKDGLLSKAEFENGWRSIRQSRRRNADVNLRRQFDAMDRNKNGGIDSNEYSNLVLVKRAGNLAPPMSEFDANHNGKLEFSEYQELVRTQAQAAQGPHRPGPTPLGK